jgi:sugar fermentation stimulation protein A
MRWPEPLIRGRLVRRYKRVLADVALEGDRLVTVHCPNPGRMLGLDAPGSPVWLSAARRPGRRLPLTPELVEVEGALVGINAMHPNPLADSSAKWGWHAARLACHGRCPERARQPPPEEREPL